MKNTGVIIARFQTPYLHEGHHELIRFVTEKHNRTIVVLGVAPVKGSRYNPFDFYTREKLIKAAYPDLLVLPLSDHPSDEAWSENLDQLLTTTFPSEPFILYGSRDSFISCYSGSLKTEEFPEFGKFNATEIRNDVSDKVLMSEDFRLGINYAYHNMYEKVYPTVDVAVFRNEGKEILLGKKATLNQWRFIGGFTDPTDANYEEAAKRELAEECGPLETGKMEYVTSMQVDDWRYRNETDKIITILYKTELVYGAPKASDDIVDTQWIATSKLPQLIQDNQIVSEHVPLMNKLLETIQK